MIADILNALPQIIRDTRELSLAAWHAYECVNAVQSLTRLTRFHGDWEVQLNWLQHANQPHIHGCDMVSLMLVKGYGFYLQQCGSAEPRYQFAAPGSLVTMGPSDTHSIAEQEHPSLSLCIFSKQTEWHLHYPAANPELAQSILDAAKDALAALNL